MVPLGVGEDGPTAGEARGPRWRRTSPGLYVPATVAAGVEQHVLEQAQRLPSGGAVGGWASLRWQGAAYFDGRVGRDRLRDVPLVVARPGHLADVPGSRAVRPRRMPGIVVVDGVPCVEPVASLVDELAAARGLRHAVAMVDMALAARVVTLAALTDRAEAGGRGATALRSALPWVDGRSRSPWETWLRLVWTLDAGLPAPRSNWLVADLEGRVVASPDLLGDEVGVVAEYDGSAHRETGR